MAKRSELKRRMYGWSNGTGSMVYHRLLSTSETVCGVTVPPGWGIGGRPLAGRDYCARCDYQHLATESPVPATAARDLRRWARAALPVGLRLHHLVSRDRTAFVSRWRDLAMLHLRERGYSYREIGGALGRDHSTVVEGVKRAIAERADASNSNREAPRNEGTEAGGLT